VVPAGEARWLVEIKPASAFVWRELRADLKRRGRRTLRETDHAIKVGALDEDDARALVAKLAENALVRSAGPRPLGFLGRWWVREHELDNYAGMMEPTQPF
jgi:hypothetical protein